MPNIAIATPKATRGGDTWCSYFRETTARGASILILSLTIRHVQRHIFFSRKSHIFRENLQQRHIFFTHHNITSFLVNRKLTFFHSLITTSHRSCVSHSSSSACPSSPLLSACNIKASHSILPRVNSHNFPPQHL